MRRSGGETYAVRLRSIAGPEGRAAVDGALLEAALEVAAKAKQLIIEGGSSSGGVHTPSKPYDPPNSDTGFLAANIRAEPIGPGIVRITAYARYSAYLEYGTSKMAPRPFMRPALRMLRPRIAALVRAAHNRVAMGIRTQTGRQGYQANARASAGRPARAPRGRAARQAATARKRATQRGGGS